MVTKSDIVYEIRVNGLLDKGWDDWFAPLKIVNLPGGEAALRGEVRDQAELRSLIDKVFNLNLTLLAVNQLQAGSSG